MPPGTRDLWAITDPLRHPKPRTCVDCGAEFLGTFNAKRCPPCREAIKAMSHPAQERRRAEKLHDAKGAAGCTPACAACAREREDIERRLRQ